MGGGKVDDRPFRFHFISGTIGGMVGSLVCFPFDTVKTFAQMNQTTSGSTTTFGILSQMIKKGGFFSIYKGVLYPFLGYGAIFSTAFGIRGTVQDILKTTIHKNDKYHAKNVGLPAYETMFCGMCAGAVSALVRTPIERVKCWSQINKIGTIETTKQLIQKFGFKDGIYYGVGATVTRDVPRFGVYYPIYQITRSAFTYLIPSDPSTSKPSTIAVFLSGGSAGVGCYITVYPLDVIKTRIQASAAGTYTGFFDCAKSIAKEGGIRSLYKGLLPTCYRAAVLHSSIFLIYENVMEYLENHYS
eukprot:233446_1